MHKTVSDYASVNGTATLPVTAWARSCLSYMSGILQSGAQSFKIKKFINNSCRCNTENHRQENVTKR